MPGPDFPTGGVVSDASRLASTYSTGEGTLVHEARIEVEQAPRPQVVVTGLPYGVLKGGENGIITAAANAVTDGRFRDIEDLRDESNRDVPTRVVFELEPGGDPDVLVRALLEHVGLRTTLNVRFAALAEGQPRVLTLRELIAAYLDGRRDTLGEYADEQIRSELQELARQFPSPRGTTIRS